MICQKKNDWRELITYKVRDVGIVGLAGEERLGESYDRLPSLSLDSAEVRLQAVVILGAFPRSICFFYTHGTMTG